MNFNKLAKDVTKVVNDCGYYDDDVTVDNVLEWMNDMDEDDLVTASVDSLAEWFMESY